jgi:hypothetical protein
MFTILAAASGVLLSAIWRLDRHPAVAALAVARHAVVQIRFAGVP